MDLVLAIAADGSQSCKIVLAWLLGHESHLLAGCFHSIGITHLLSFG